MLDYSIIIPVFNKAELTRNCLTKLRAGIEGCGEGEVIVIDNASSDHTPQMLAEFPWIRVIRNDRNLGFSGANNQGAREARGQFLVLLNNDTESIGQWLAPMLRVASEPDVGIVGARLLFANGTLQHAGVIVRSAIMGAAGFIPYHYLFGNPASDPEAARRRDFQVVTGACVVTRRDLYLDLGGLDEGFWNGYEDVDYCFKVGERGLRVVYEPQATLFHFESQSGSQRFRRTQANVQRLSERWKGRVDIDAPRVYTNAGVTVGIRRVRKGGLASYATVTRPVSVVVHGFSSDFDRENFAVSLDVNRTPIGTVYWAQSGQEIGTARAAMTVRGDRHLAVVRADTTLSPGWLDELLARVNGFSNAAAATFAGEVVNGSHVPLLATDGRCVLLRLRAFPQHMALSDFDTLDGSIADLLLRGVDAGLATIGVRAHATVGSPVVDASFESSYGMPLAAVEDRDPGAIERRLRQRPPFARGLVSIVMLSWNAPEFTLRALQSIRSHTQEPYEVVIVDNGSGPETLAALATIADPHVRIFYNKTNRGFSGGNNDGIARTKGDYVILLNNDVIVTPGWTDNLIDAFRRIPSLGISSPRSNQITGEQQVDDSSYTTDAEMFAYAERRRLDYARSGFLIDRAIGFCWCLPRTVLETVGALDERYSLGNFEDDDYCLRVRAAGYHIYVCDDVFIHHFGSRSFAANKVDYAATMGANWEKFSRKWGFDGPLPAKGYNGSVVHGRGFDPARHFIPFPIVEPEPAHVVSAVEPRAVFAVDVRSEPDWALAAQFVKRFASAFRSSDPVRLSIGTFAEPDALTVAARVQKILERAGVRAENVADIDIVDYESEEERNTERDARLWVDIASIEDRSPSGLRKLVERREV